MKIPLVSIIIPSYNSANFIDLCLSSIKKQTYKNIEIIVVDKGSEDDTILIAERYTSKVFTYGFERGAQLNYGFGKAKGKYIYRVDSDFVVEKNVVKECVELCEKEKLDGVAVHNTSAEGLGFWSDVRKLERNTYRDDDLMVAVRFFRKSVLERIGKFDERLAGPEDFEFHNQFVNAHLKYGRIKSIERHLGEPRSLLDIWNKFFYYGKSNYLYFKKHPKIASKQYMPIRPSYIRHLKELTSNPILFGGFIIMNIVKYTAGGLGFLWGFIKDLNGSKFRTQGVKITKTISHYGAKENKS